jgi:aminoglycoside phosphotransferase (APT) family kinase protein
VTFDEDLRRWVETETGAAVVEAAPLGNGASRRTWAVDLDDARAVVVREDPGTGPVAGTPLTLGREALVYLALSGAPVPVPTLLATRADGQALLFTRVPGTDVLKELSVDERQSVACDYGRCLGRLHASDLGLASLGWGGNDDPTHADIALWRSILDSRCGTTPTPVSAPALDWLASHVPDNTRTSLCHGDAGPGNFLHDAGAVTGLVDWEFAHVGDPHDDLAWVAVRNQLLGRPLDLDVVVAGWHDAGRDGVDVGLDVPLDVGLDPQRLEYFRALVLVRMAISCDAALEWTGGETTPETRTQGALRPFLAPAIIEALHRAGCTEPFTRDLAGAARAVWERSLISGLLGDPSNLDDLGALR